MSKFIAELGGLVAKAVFIALVIFGLSTLLINNAHAHDSVIDAGANMPLKNGLPDAPKSVQTDVLDDVTTTIKNMTKNADGTSDFDISSTNNVHVQSEVK